MRSFESLSEEEVLAQRHSRTQMS